MDVPDQTFRKAEVAGCSARKLKGLEWKIMEFLHPGVDAFGYVKRTTPDLLSSTSFFNVTFSPSLVSTSPPNPSIVIVSPAATLLAVAFTPFVDEAPILLEVEDLTELAFFTGGGCGAVSAGALRLRSSTILAV